MPLLLGIDLGTTKLTAIVFDPETGEVIARSALSNDANCTSEADRSRGRSEWNATRIIDRTLECVHAATTAARGRAVEIAAIGVTGQQHGALLIDDRFQPMTPLINWQDRRGNDPLPGERGSFVDGARDRLGSDLARRCGCQLQTGFMATLLFWMKSLRLLPSGGQACFIMDLFVSRLTGEPPVCEPTGAGSSGVFDVVTRDWNRSAIAALDLPQSLFPCVREATQPVGQIETGLAKALSLPTGLQIFPALGDHQASFAGTVRDRRQSALVNVGTGAQVAVFSSGVDFQPPVELRPFPIAGNLLSNVGLAGGWSYQLLEQFFSRFLSETADEPRHQALYPQLNRLAEAAPAGAEGLRCDPTFAGTRSDPAIRGSFTGISPQNFTPAHFARALLEGMARTLHAGFGAIKSSAAAFQPLEIIAAGNGLRENRLLARLVAEEFRLPLRSTRICEEAAVGAALVAAVGEGIYRTLEDASQTLRHETIV